MNHYPTARAVDRAMRQQAGLSAVDVGNEPTWRITGTNHEEYGKVASFFTRREVACFDSQYDDMLYRGVKPLRTEVVDIASDHRAIMTTFEL